MRIEIAYNESPALFDRDAATRKSAGRKELRAETGAYRTQYLRFIADTTLQFRLE
jgi:hypothetical protein